MHEAYIVHSLTKLKISVESMTAYDNNVLIGTRSGDILMYSVKKNETNNKMELDLLKFHKNFSKKAVVQLAVAPIELILFSLSDNMINVCDISLRDRTGTNFTILHSVVQTRGASIFCIAVNKTKTQSLTAESKVEIRLCIAIKRKLEFYYWKNNELLQLQLNSIELQDIPKALLWVDDIICVGFKDEYVIYNINEPTKKNFLVTTNQDPCICLLKNNMFGLAKDEFLVAINMNKFIIKKLNEEKTEEEKLEVLGCSFQLNPLTWTKSLLEFVWDEPYVIGRNANCLEIRCLETKGFNKDTLIQSIPELNKARFISRSGKGSLFAAAFSELWYIEAVDIVKQRINLLQQKRYQLAINLTDISDEQPEEKKEIIQQIQIRFAKELFLDKQFTESMNLFIEMKSDAYDVIQLFPTLRIQKLQAIQAESTESKSPVSDDKDLENALIALQIFLTNARQREVQRLTTENKSKTSELMSIIDTTLLKCYLQTNDSPVGALLRLNHCHLEESEKILKKHKKYKELIILYQTTGMHKRALDLLQLHSTINDSSLYGHERTIKYLLDLGYKSNKYQDLIFEYSKWVLDKHPKDGLTIFTELEKLPRADVLDHLLKYHKDLVIPYLEHIIHVWVEKKPMFHTILIKQYKINVMNLIQECKSIDSTATIDYNEKMKKLKESREKLIKFLKSSECYALEVILKEFPTTDLFEERAILLSKLNKHEKVFAIYLQILGSIEKAEEYCDKIYDKEKNIYTLLIQTLLIPPTEPPYTDVKLHPNFLNINIEMIINLLDKYADKIKPSIVLEHLPGDIPLVRLKNYLEIALRNQLERKRQNQILKGLLKSEKLQLQEELMKLEMENVIINDAVACLVCKKRFVDQSAFVRYPNGDIVHYSCQEKMSN